MTQAALARTTIKQSDTYPHVTHRNENHSLRLIIDQARPLLPHNLARNSKVLAALNIWKKCRTTPIGATETHLINTGLPPNTPIPSDVRFHCSALYEPTQERFPAMVCAVRNSDGGFTGIHRTFLARNGSGFAKPDGDARRMLGHCYGSYVQLSEATAFRLIITETVEMALLIRQSCPDLPVWAAMTIGNMKSPVPSSVGEVILCIDSEQKTPELASKLLMDAARAGMSNRKASGSCVRFTQP